MNMLGSLIGVLMSIGGVYEISLGNDFILGAALLMIGVIIFAIAWKL